LRGRTSLGSTLTETMARYSEELQNVHSKLMVVLDNDNVLDQLSIAGVTESMGEENIYRSTKWLSKTVRRANDEAEAWIAENADGANLE